MNSYFDAYVVRDRQTELRAHAEQRRLRSQLRRHARPTIRHQVRHPLTVARGRLAPCT